MKVLITDKINETAKQIIDEAAEGVILPTMSEDELCSVIAEYSALMVRSQTKVTAKVIEAAKNLKILLLTLRTVIQMLRQNILLL